MRENLLHYQNAKNLTRDELVQTFVMVPLFLESLQAKNQLMVGTRGSGKTVFGKMMSHSHLTRYAHLRGDRRIQAIIRRQEIIGTYVACSELVAANEAERPEFARWLINATTVAAFFDTADSCFETYSKHSGSSARLEFQEKFTASIGRRLEIPGLERRSFSECNVLLDDLRRFRQSWENRKFGMGDESVPRTPPGFGLDIQLHDVMKLLVSSLREQIGMSESANWTFCFDEIEVLSDQVVLHLNAFLRSGNRPFSLKLITLPYKISEETPYAEPLVRNSDYDPLYLDGPLRRWWTSENIVEYGLFAKQVYERRVPVVFDNDKLQLPKNFRDLVGVSTLFDRGELDVALNARSMQDRLEIIRAHCSPAVYETAVRESVERPEFFLQSMWNKISRNIYLRQRKQNIAGTAGRRRTSKGNEQPEHYSGLEMLLRLSDGNPRNLIQIMDRIIQRTLEVNTPRSAEGRQTKYRIASASKRLQAEIVRQYSADVLARHKKEIGVSNGVVNLVEAIGILFSAKLYGKVLPKDVPGSVNLPNDSEVHEIALSAIKIGLLYPNVRAEDGGRMPPIESGSFRLAGGLAPHFGLLPSRGSTIKLRITGTTIKALSEASTSLEDFDER